MLPPFGWMKQPGEKRQMKSNEKSEPWRLAKRKQFVYTAGESITERARRLQRKAVPMATEIMRVNLTRGTTGEEPVPEAYRYLGGRALTGRIITDEVDPRCHPGCPIRCSNIVHDSHGDYLTNSLEYETITMFGSNCLIENLGTIARVGLEYTDEDMIRLGEEVLTLERNYNRAAGLPDIDLPDWFRTEKLPPFDLVFDIPVAELAGIQDFEVPLDRDRVL